MKTTKAHALPELVERRRSRQKWTHHHAPHTPDQPSADPRRRTIHAAHLRDKAAHAQRLTALVGSRYNSHRPQHIAPIWSDNTAQTRQLFLAAQELRNRRLAHIADPDIPHARYCLPEQLAAHHASRKTFDHTYALELAALFHHPTDLATYLDTLTNRYDAAELADETAQTALHIDNEIQHLTKQLRENPNAYTQLQNPTGKKLRLTPAEYAAKCLQLQLEQLTTTAQNTTKARKKRQREKRQTELRRTKEAANGTPSASDLTGWYPVIMNKPPREITHTGRLGRRRIATNAGKNPNRIHNYAGDPMRRIFSRKTRGTNALVIVDCSGSMSLTPDDLAAIMTASAGATVIGYSADDSRTPNTHLLAHKGTRVRTMPHFAGNNGNDAPAADYAVKNYRKTDAPVLWITDGRATGSGRATSEPLRSQCRRIAQRHGITISRTVPEALADLALIRAGKTPPQRLDTF